MKATIGELKYDTVKTKLIKIFSDTSDVPTSELTNLNIVLKILSIKTKNSLENPHVAQTIITILSSIETETKSYKKKYHTKLLDTYNGHSHNHNQITEIGELPSKKLQEDHNLNKVKIS